jgi:hypothetical protein
MTSRPLQGEPKDGAALGLKLHLIGQQQEAEERVINFSQSLRSLLNPATQLSLMERINSHADLKVFKSFKEEIDKSILQSQANAEQYLKFIKRDEKIRADFLKDIFDSENAYKKLVDSVYTPESKGLLALLVRFKSALKDKEILQSKVAEDLLTILCELLSTAPLNADAQDILNPLTVVAKKSARSQLAAENAAKKNSDIKKWVLKEWPKFKAKRYSKSRFADWCIANVPPEHSGKIPKKDQITKVWLK